MDVTVILAMARREKRIDGFSTWGATWDVVHQMFRGDWGDGGDQQEVALAGGEV